MTKRDYYEVLGLSRSATADEIKKAFRKMAREYHPDVNKDPSAEGLFKELGEAYEVLSDDQKRQVYDNYGHAGFQGGGGYQASYDFAQGFPDLGDIFSSFFGGGFGGQQQRAAQTGEDLRFDLELDFMDAAFGTKREVDIPQMQACQPCHSTGASPDSKGPISCTTCGGQGQVRSNTQTILGNFTQIVTCPHCQGAGSVIENPCSECRGEGRQQLNKKITLTIPAGVDSGTRMRVSSEGNAGKQGTPAGDLYVFLYVKEHDLFRREGADLISTVHAKYTQLVLGDEIKVPGLQEEEHLKIPAGTQHGAVFTLKNKGIPLLNGQGRRGDYHIQVVLDVPKKLAGEERKLLEQLKQLEEGHEINAHPHKFTERLKEVFTGHA
jgi:molecular chaperone DnaJ